jgi:hypothetical protein
VLIVWYSLRSFAVLPKVERCTGASKWLGKAPPNPLTTFCVELKLLGILLLAWNELPYLLRAIGCVESSLRLIGVILEDCFGVLRGERDRDMWR